MSIFTDYIVAVVSTHLALSFVRSSSSGENGNNFLGGKKIYTIYKLVQTEMAKTFHRWHIYMGSGTRNTSYCLNLN